MSPNETNIISGISPHNAEAVDAEDFSGFLNRRKHLFGLATLESKEVSQNAVDAAQPPVIVNLVVA